MSLQHIQKNSPRLLPKPAKFEKNPPNGYRVIRKTKCGAGGAAGAGRAGRAGGARSSPIHKQASLVGRLMSRGTHDCVDREIANAKPFQFRDSQKRYISVHHQSNRPLTGSETHEIKTMQFPINEITIKVPICKKYAIKLIKVCFRYVFYV